MMQTLVPQFAAAQVDARPVFHAPSHPVATSGRLRRILFVSCNYSHDYSWMTWGTYIRMQQLLQGAAAAAARVEVLLLVAPDIAASVDPAVVEASLQKHWGVAARVRFGLRSPNPRGRVVPLLRSLFDFRQQAAYRRTSRPAQAAEVARALDDDVDLVMIHRLDAAAACVAAAKGRVPIAINLDTIEHQEMTRRLAVHPPAGRGSRLVERLRLRALRRGEIGILDACSCLLVCSQNERTSLAADGIAASIEVIPNARDFDDARTALDADAAGRTLMFFGSYGYLPNVLAADEMITRIFPLVRELVPDARLLIAGNLVEQLPSFNVAHPGVEMVTDVVDVGQVYRRANVACAPIRTGGGTRIKIIEASSWKKAIVSTRIGAEGLDLVDGTDIVLCDDPAGFARECARLLKDPEAAAAMGRRAFDKARAVYDRPMVVERIADVLTKVGMRMPSPGPSP